MLLSLLVHAAFVPLLVLLSEAFRYGAERTNRSWLNTLGTFITWVAVGILALLVLRVLVVVLLATGVLFVMPR